MRTPLQLDDSFICPITGDAIKDPVVDHEGNSYEKTAILEWLSRNQTSPITRNPLRIDQLAPNRILQELFESEDVEDTEAVAPFLVPSPSFEVSTQVISSTDGYALIQVSVTDEKSTSHSPASIICVIDVSGSMSSAATMHNDKEGSGGLSLLDIVKHATRTVIETLAPQDRLAVIAYDNAAQLVIPLTCMTSENKQKAWKAVDNLCPGGGTNLWGGLAEAMYIANLEEGEHCHILLLTDGQPTMHPPRGELETLCRYREKNPKTKATISTFGFGYAIQSKLLGDIAVEGNGHYCFIPDSSFVGTVFVNAAANVLATAFPEAVLLVEGEVEDLSGLGGTLTLPSCCGKSSGGLDSGKTKFNLPPLIYGQTLDILVQASGGGVIQSKNVALTDAQGQALCTAFNTSDKNALDLATFRSKVVQFVESSMHKLSANQSKHVYDAIQTDLVSLATQFDSSLAPFEALRSDVEGQITEAFSRSVWYQKWGRHYLLSLARAYVLQQCTNFKDPGVQIYSTEKFSAIRDTSEEIFCKLPPPAPSRPLTRNYAPVRSMSNYYQSSGPCFARGAATLANGAQVDISELRSGDVVESSDGLVRVKCIVKTFCKNGVQELVELDGEVLVTKYHPIRAPESAQWSFPNDLAAASEIECDAVYSFVLDEGDFLQIGPYQGIALGHGITSDPVAEHNYLGTEKVLSDLAEMDGWSEGFVILGSNPCFRDPESGLIVKLNQKNMIENVS
mmetsp:Transcript_16662/g.27621  ORF Transcript_16662/g.27621 Transcript_16662/m.27621 type:complete len:734 (-) Transcript_16662:218-2419(-)|eukprot:CAMPEP_0119020868 /NCGR_PEP_ID=MMETSP1176-20130426/24906_1 /TAXON_ID=265551 /ORGANISM="Synedropsis recta cf, Strain CCMP1620" /LENGTH=733 /DNA_ID=CAMNT_0006975363 /DNA_START=24 /DNA_END=2225 /DNA_ORIENTATION=-